MKFIKYFIVVFIGFFVFAACQKELSLETGAAGTAVGTFAKDSATDNCQPISVNGTYNKDSTLRDSNYVLVNVNVTTAGMYKIVTTTENGYFFQDSSYFAAAGPQTVKLKAFGKPEKVMTSNFVVQFGSSFCNFSVTATQGSGGTGGSSGTAAYALAGAPGSCTTPVIAGTYTTGTALTTANTVTLNVNVTTVGTFSITTPTSNGMTFSGSGTFTTTGPQTIRLTGSGIPVIAGSTPVPVTMASSTCTFNITVAQGTGSGSGSSAADTAWSFNQGSRFFYGRTDGLNDTLVVDSASGTSRMVLVVDGYTYPGGDSAIQIIIMMPGTTLQSGTYTTTSSSEFAFYDSAYPPEIYLANFTTTNASISIVLSYNSTTRLATGTFAGTALTATGTAVPITNGKFRGTVQ
ncbi:MAG: hypothetical protein JWQ96_1592 [Segetibacter sp.]|nr:hypothetical protein [Segetibacter sp.]